MIGDNGLGAPPECLSPAEKRAWEGIRRLAPPGWRHELNRLGAEMLARAAVEVKAGARWKYQVKFLRRLARDFGIDADDLLAELDK